MEYKDKKEYVGYICGIAAQCELGETDVTVYPSLEHMKKFCKHDLTECGIVRISIKCEEWLIPQDIFKNIKK